METLKKYSAPSCDVLEVDLNSIVCVSGPDYGDGGDLDYLVI